MRGKSHICLGEYLIEHYLNDASALHQTAFLFGCVQPDRNPLTYLKGSFRCQWLRGHNYPNASRFMRRISLRLEQRETLNSLDYYTLGKLIHYTADAFTYAHDESFPESLSGHRTYEAKLQKRFLIYLQQKPKIHVHPADSIMDSICRYHSTYTGLNRNIHTDCVFALHACCCVLTLLLSRNML